MSRYPGGGSETRGLADSPTTLDNDKQKRWKKWDYFMRENFEVNGVLRGESEGAISEGNRRVKRG